MQTHTSFMEPSAHLKGKIGIVRNVATKKVAWRTNWGWNVCFGHKLDVLPLLISLIEAPDHKIGCISGYQTYTLFKVDSSAPHICGQPSQRQLVWHACRGMETIRWPTGTAQPISQGLTHAAWTELLPQNFKFRFIHQSLTLCYKLD